MQLKTSINIFFLINFVFLNGTFIFRLQTENNEQLIKILEYMECPQYLRKSLFPPHKYLEHVGKIEKLRKIF